MYRPIGLRYLVNVRKVKYGRLDIGNVPTDYLQSASTRWNTGRFCTLEILPSSPFTYKNLLTVRDC